MWAGLMATDSNLFITNPYHIFNNFPCSHSIQEANGNLMAYQWQLHSNFGT